GVSHGLVVQEKSVEKGDAQPHVVVAGLNDICSEAGLKKGDVIVGVGSVAVANSFDLERALWDTKPGQQVTVRLVRDGQEINVTLILAAMPPGAALQTK